MKRLLPFLGFFLVLNSYCPSVHGQEGFSYSDKGYRQFPLGGTVKVAADRIDYSPTLQHLEAPKPGGTGYANFLNKIKESIQPKEGYFPKQKATLEPPILRKGFEGNRFFTGVPNDNDLAISDSGHIVSVVNTNFSVFDTAGTLLQSLSLESFADTLGIKSHKYDPRVLYDPEQHRFVVCFLAGSNDSTNFIIFGFSKTENPTGDWNLYAISGEPLSDTTWSDYPIIALTKGEVVLTLNAIQNNKSWQEGFRQTYVWVIDKATGYAGSTLKTRLLTGLQYNGRPIRNFCPVQGGRGLEGGQIYLLSNRNFSPSNDTFFLAKLSGPAGDLGANLTLKVVKSSAPYGVPPHARQTRPKLATLQGRLQTNDARVLDAIIVDSAIHFVGNSIVPSNNRAGVYHGRLADPGGQSNLTLQVLGDPALDFGYPAIAATNDVQDEGVILVNYSSDNTPLDSFHPGNGAFFYNGIDHSPLRITRKGKSHIAITALDNERWGDYSGIQRRYNRPGSVWMGATFGQQIKQGTSTYFTHGTWISEVLSPSGQVGIAENTSIVSDLKTFPNPLPAYQPFRVEFAIEKTEMLRFSLSDMQGRVVKELLFTQVKAGLNSFSFNTEALLQGMYHLTITRPDGQTIVQKVVVK